MSRYLIFMIFSCVTFSAAVSADTLVNIKNEQGQKTSFMSNGKYGRMNTAGEDTYMIVHYASQSIKVIMPAQRQVLDMSGGMPVMGVNMGKAPEKINMRLFQIIMQTLNALLIVWLNI